MTGQWIVRMAGYIEKFTEKSCLSRYHKPFMKISYFLGIPDASTKDSETLSCSEV